MSAVDENPPIPELHKAVIRGDIEQVSKLVNHSNVNSTTPDSLGLTPLCIACSKNDLNMVEFLLKIPGIAVNTAAGYGGTALHCAANVGNRAILKLLLGAMANLECRDARGQTPIFHTLSEPDACVGMGGPALHHPALSFLIGNNANLSVVDARGRSLLWLACRNNDKNAVALICERVSENSRAITTYVVDEVPLVNMVVERRFHGVLRMLLTVGAPADMPSPLGVRPLDIAVNLLDAVSVDTLLEHGAYPNSHLLTSAFDSSVAGVDPSDVAIKLCAAGATESPHLPMTLLEIATLRNRPRLACLALWLHPEYSLPTFAPKMLDIVLAAIDHRSEKLAELLLILGPNLSGMKDSRGATVHARASYRGCHELLRELPEIYAVKNSPHPLGQTPITSKIRTLQQIQRDVKEGMYNNTTFLDPVRKSAGVGPGRNYGMTAVILKYYIDQLAGHATVSNL
jgi:ankyrin repeat protein